jgi:hypothetical protein
MRYPDDIRVIVRQCLPTGMALSAGICLSPLALDRHGKNAGDKFLAGGFFAVYDVCVGNLPGSERADQMLLDLLLPDDIPEFRHSYSFPALL